MRDYIPDLTERFPEGLDGVDMWEPRNPEYEMWAALEAQDENYCDEDGNYCDEEDKA